MNIYFVYEISIFVLRLKNLVSLWTLFTKLHPDFHSMCILEFNGSGCYNLKLNTSVLFCKKNNIPPERLYDDSLTS